MAVHASLSAIRCLAVVVPLMLLAFRQDTEDKQLERGQKYLDKVARTWDGNMPVRKLIGIYIGRRWTGYMRLEVKQAPAGSGAAFEFGMKGEVIVGDRKFRGEGRTLLARDLSPVAVEFSNSEAGMVEEKKLTVEGGHWKLRRDLNGNVTESEGEIRPGTTWGAEVLPFFAVPDDPDLTLISIDGGKGPYRFTVLLEKRARRIGETSGEFRILEVAKGEDKPDLSFFGEDGRTVELLPQGGPARLVPIPEDKMGDDLDEPLDLKPPERVVVDLFLAIKRNDRDAMMDCFDMERLTAEMVPSYAEMTAEEQKQAVEMMPARLADYLLSDRMRESLPEERILEDGIAIGMQTAEDGDVARVVLFDQQVWKLRRVTEGEREGKWLIVGVEPK